MPPAASGGNFLQGKGPGDILRPEHPQVQEMCAPFPPQKQGPLSPIMDAVF